MSNTPSVPTVAARRGVEDHEFATAEEVIEALRPRHALWGGQPQRWLYRGQADAAWALETTAARDPDVFRRFGVALRPDLQGQASWSQRSGLLLDMLITFRTLLNMSGIALPQREPRISTWESGELQTDALPLEEAYPLMALAQHHGLPTVMLDWTRRGWVAAYFAAADAAKRLVAGEATTHFAVWALHRRAISDRTEAIELVLHQAPGFTNPNMNAQGGFVTISLDQDNRSLDRQLETRGVLKRIVAPTSEAPKLLRMLSEEGVDGASMFPGASGVVMSMKESALWDHPPRPLTQ